MKPAKGEMGGLLGGGGKPYLMSALRFSNGMGFGLFRIGCRWGWGGRGSPLCASWLGGGVRKSAEVRLGGWQWIGMVAKGFVRA